MELFAWVFMHDDQFLGLQNGEHPSPPPTHNLPGLPSFSRPFAVSMGLS